MSKNKSACDMTNSKERFCALYERLLISSIKRSHMQANLEI